MARLRRNAKISKQSKKKSWTKFRAPLEKENGGSMFYGKNHRILVVGDGDFSYSRGLVNYRGSGKNVIATSYDGNSTVLKKYTNSEECISFLQKNETIVLHNIDGTKLHSYRFSNCSLEKDVFDFIIFNFPHSGQQRVHVNRVLLLDFFCSARAKLAPQGQIHMTLKTKPPYSNWNVEEQAKKAGLFLKKTMKFNIKDFPGYCHRTTDPQAKKFEPDFCLTYMFIIDCSKTIDLSDFQPTANQLVVLDKQEHNNQRLQFSANQLQKKQQEHKKQKLVQVQQTNAAALKSKKPIIPMGENLKKKNFMTQVVTRKYRIGRFWWRPRHREMHNLHFL